MCKEVFDEAIGSSVIAVTNRSLCLQRLFKDQIRRVCKVVHPKAVILREKDLSEQEYTTLLGDVLDICREYDVKLIPHFYPEAAVRFGLDTVHLPLWKLKELNGRPGKAAEQELSGVKDGLYDSPEEGLNERRKDGRTESGISLRFGCSVHSAEEAEEAERLGAVYLTAGHIFETACKEGLPGRGLAFLREICEKANVPVYAIGGIGPDPRQIREVCECGASGVCIMSGMMRL